MIVLLILIGLAALVAAPLFLPWRFRLRWMIAANAIPDAWSGSLRPDVLLDEVRVISGAEGDVVWISAGGTRQPVALSTARVESVDRRLLAGWAAAQTPLLRIVCSDGATSLHDEWKAVSGLHAQWPDRSSGHTAPGPGSGEMLGDLAGRCVRRPESRHGARVPGSDQ